jgi:hypothetical protein
VLAGPATSARRRSARPSTATICSGRWLRSDSRSTSSPSRCTYKSTERSVVAPARGCVDGDLLLYLFFFFFLMFLCICLMTLLCPRILSSGDRLVTADGGMWSSYAYLIYPSKQHLFAFASAELCSLHNLFRFRLLRYNLLENIWQLAGNAHN